MSDSSDHQLSRGRTILFKIIAVGMSLSLLVFAELGLRLFHYGGSMRLFVDHRVEHFEDYYIVNPFIGLKYFHRFKATEATNDIFLKEKPENGFRIFVLGSSTVYGFPFDRNLMASRILHKRLQDAYPDKTIELVNTSITAINTVTLKDFARQIMKYEPDALLIYAGHNEFYGAFGIGSQEGLMRNSFFRGLHFKMMNLRLYQLMQAAIYRTGKKEQNNSDSEDQKGTLMKRIVKDQDIVYGGEKYRYGINQFRDNLSDVLDLASRRKVPVFIGDLVSNVKDIHPFGDAGDEDQSAFFNYAAAQQALSERDTALATTLFYKAKDLDPVRFRASEEINQIIHRLVSEKGATLVPVRRSFSDASTGGMIGNNLLTEHVHPNIDGQFLMAQSFFEEIVDSKLIGESPDPLTVKPEAYYRGRWGYTPLDSLMADFRVRQLKSYWPYQTLDNEVRFRDVFKPEGLLEEMAFSVITDPEATAESLHDRLGNYYESNLEYARALKEYKALATINPNWPDYLNKAANSYFNLNDLYAAEQYLRESLKFEDSYFSLSMLGEIEFIKHDYQQALHLFEQAYQVMDESSLNADGKIFLLSRLHYLYRKFNDAARMQEMASELARLGQQPETIVEDLPFTYSEYVPYDIKADFFRAVDFAGNNLDSSLFYLKHCLAINDCPVVNLYVGDVLYQKQDLQALHYYRKAYEAYDRDPGYLTRLFYAYFVNVNKAGAKAALDQLMAVDPAYPEIPRLQTLLGALQ